MTEPKDIAGYYLDRYKKMISFANKLLAIALLILVINWLFAVEPGFAFILETRQKYKSQLKETEKKLLEYIDTYDRYYNKNSNDSIRNKKNIILADSLQNQISNYTPTTKKISLDQLRDSLSHLSNLIEKYSRDSINRAEYKAKLSLYGDSIQHIKDKRAELNSVKATSLEENLQGYDWKSLIKFVFIVAANPKEGSLYLMGLIALISIVAFIYRWLCLHYLSKAIRIYKTESSLGINSYKDLSIPAPFWLAPLPVKNGKVRIKGKTEGGQDFVSPEELATLMGLRYLKKRYALWIILMLIFLLALQLRIFYIGLSANPPIRFDFVFTIGIILTLLTTVQIVLWIFPLRIDPHLNDEPSANKIERRLFICAFALGVTSFIFFRKKNAISKFYGLNAKRYPRTKYNKKPTHKMDITPGLYYARLKHTTKYQNYVMYYFNSNTNRCILKDINRSNEFNAFKKKLVPLKDEEMMSNHNFQFTYRFQSLQTEQYTLDLLKVGKKSDALKFILKQLYSGVSFDPRVIDLAVRLCIIFDKTGVEFTNLLKYLENKYERPENLDNGNFIIIESDETKMLRQRLYKWGNRNWVSSVKAKRAFVWNNITF